MNATCRCPICHSTAEKISRCKTTLVFGTEYDLVECPACGVLYFLPLPTSAQLTRFYSAAYYNFDRWREEGKGMAFARPLKRWKSTGKFLDVGCATGFFIHGIQQHSPWEVYGTDFGASAVQFARAKLGLDVQWGNLVDVHFSSNYFDYVHVNNVLEHVLSPLELLQECHRVIKPDGILHLSVPNGFVDSRDLLAFYNEEHQPARSKHGHIFFFQKHTLLYLFDKVGFEITKKQTYGWKRGLRSIGKLPKKRNWKTGYYPCTSPEPSRHEEDINIRERKKKFPDWYYYCRFWQSSLHRIAGLHNIGLDFLFLLRAKK
jgi:2-polyprenyl-3-methyl-5-hydroxy-6-metoxy-1,4-benzoquinol methylase